MKQRFKITPPEEPAEYPLSKMEVGEIGILTKTSPVCRELTGHLVVRAHSEYALPATGQYLPQSDVVQGYRFRRLYPHEVLQITRED